MFGYKCSFLYEGAEAPRAPVLRDQRRLGLHGEVHDVVRRIVVDRVLPAATSATPAALPFGMASLCFSVFVFGPSFGLLVLLCLFCRSGFVFSRRRAAAVVVAAAPLRAHVRARAVPAHREDVIHPPARDEAPTMWWFQPARGILY